MKRRLFIAFIGAAASLVAAAEGGLDVSVRLLQREFLPGEPVTAHITITNTSGAGITFFGKMPNQGVRASVRLKNPSGEVIMCGGETSGLIVSQDPNRPPPQCTLGPGESIQLDYQADTLSCPLSQFPAGRYILRVEVTKLPQWGKEPWPRLALLEENIEIAAPAGENLAALQDIEKAIATRDPKNLKGGTLQQKPLGWTEVLQSIRVNSGAIILARHTTSTYAGHVLAHSVPPLAQESLACLNDPDGTLRQYGDRGGGEANAQTYIRKTQDAMRQYASAVGPFLAAHPDFVHAPLIRKMFAMCLGLTGHVSEALAEVRVLANGTGKEAEEAKAFLVAGEQSGAKSAPPPQPAPVPPVATSPPAAPSPTK